MKVRLHRARKKLKTILEKERELEVDERNILRVREKINSQILSVEAPGWQGVKEQEYQAYSELSQRCQAEWIGA